jgi:hypothetical protein
MNETGAWKNLFRSSRASAAASATVSAFSQGAVGGPLCDLEPDLPRPLPGVDGGQQGEVGIQAGIEAGIAAKLTDAGKEFKKYEHLASKSLACRLGDSRPRLLFNFVQLVYFGICEFFSYHDYCLIV